MYGPAGAVSIFLIVAAGLAQVFLGLMDSTGCGLGELMGLRHVIRYVNGRWGERAGADHTSERMEYS